MINLFPRTSAVAQACTRRQWMRMSAAGMAGVAQLLGSQALRANSPTGAGTAKRCIQIFLCGGPSQPDLWDMKPEAPDGVRSEFKPIQTTVPGIQFGELIPQVAQHADKLAIIRSMTHTNNDHNGAIAHALLGQLPAIPGQVYVARNDHPAIGGILHKLLGDCGSLPAWVVLPRVFTTLAPPHKGQTGGFLGPGYDPLAFDKPPLGSLTDAPLKIGSLELPEGVTTNRFSARRTLNQSLGAPVEGASTTRAEELYERAYGLIGARTRSTFDLEQETPQTRDRYGRNEYGQSLLMARRLVESGVRFVNVFWTFFDTKGCQFNLWDNHGVPNDVCGIDGQLTGRQQLTHQYCTPSFDRSFSALLEDMTDRGLLEDTLVVVGGEFGRTPKINKTAGRDHWAPCYSQLFAGGGVRGGTVYGASDAQGAYVKDSPVTPDDAAATVLHAFGIDPDAAVPDTAGRPVRVTTGQPVTALF